MALEDHEIFFCPYCDAENTLLVDLTAGSRQSFVLDCEVCCAPIAVRLTISGENILAIDARKENE